MKKMSLIEELIYYASILFSFGATWLAKIIIKKAILESKDV